MAGTALKAQWVCREPGCPEGGEGTGKAVDKAAEKHTKQAGHATSSWSEPMLPIKLPGR